MKLSCNKIKYSSLSNVAILICAYTFCTISFFGCKDKNINQNAIDYKNKNPWAEMLDIIAAIDSPTFPNEKYNVIDFGADPTGKISSGNNIAMAIKKCHQSGGGYVIIPKGDYISGPIHLMSNVNLHLEEGSIIRFSTDPKDYLPLVNTSFEGIEMYNYSPLIYANNQTNIAVTGKGTLDGQASNENWWKWKGALDYGWTKGTPHQKDSLGLPTLAKMAEDGVAIEDRRFGEGRYLRPTFIEPFECQNVLIQGIKIIHAPFWIIHPYRSTDITVDGVTVESHGPNNDGCDPEHCKNVLIKNCTFNTGDDCIAIKSGRDHDGRRINIKSENIIVQNCKMIDGHGGVVMGSEISSGVRNVFVEDCKMSSPNLDRVIRIKTNSRRGGTTENVYVRNIEVGEVRECVLKINMHYATYENQTGDYPPTIRNIHLQNIKVKKGGKFGLLINGLKESPIKNITLRNVSISQVELPYSIDNAIDIDFIDTYFNGSLIDDINI